MLIFHYVASGLLLLLSALSAVKAPIWWIKIWDFARLYLNIVILLLLASMPFIFEAWNEIEIMIAGSLVIAFAYHTSKILPFTPIFPKEIKTAKEVNNNIKLLTCNVRMSNRTTAQLQQLIKEFDPDIVLLTEPDTQWLEDLKALENDYTYHIKQPQDNTYGIAFYSKLPLKNSSVKFLVEPEVPSVHTDIVLNEQETIQFYGLHPRPPAPWTKEENKDIELMMVANMVKSSDLPAIVSGDLNDIGWSDITNQFKEISGLGDPRIGRGFFNTYNANIPVFRYPIDHFFLNKRFSIKTIKRLSHVGSDHFPVYLNLNLEPK